MRRGFTLIELMIGIAILAILVAPGMSQWETLSALTRERDYRLAQRVAQLQAEQVRAAPLASLPPRELKVSPQGTVDLGVVNLVEGSVTVRGLDGTPLGAPLEVDLARGRLRLDPVLARRTVVVNYRFGGLWGRAEGEAYTASPAGLVRLQNTPVSRVMQVTLARGDELEILPATSWKLSDARLGLLQLPARAAGRVVLVGYAGERLHTEVWGEFRGDLLETQTVPSPLKLMHVDVTYGGGRKASLAVLRVPR